VQLERVDKHKDPLLKDVIDYVLQNSFKKNIFINDHVEKGTSEAYTSMKQEINLSGTQYIKMSPIYTGAAQIIKDSVNNYGQNLIAIESRADLSALIFTDALYPYIQHDSNVQLVNTNLKNKDFLNASIYALQIASKGYYIDHIDKKLRGNL
jgi:hypothetical protein